MRPTAALENKYSALPCQRSKMHTTSCGELQGQTQLTHFAHLGEKVFTIAPHVVSWRREMGTRLSPGISFVTAPFATGIDFFKNVKLNCEPFSRQLLPRFAFPIIGPQRRAFSLLLFPRWTLKATAIPRVRRRTCNYICAHTCTQHSHT